MQPRGSDIDIAQLFERWYWDVARYAARRVGVAAADDIAADTFAVAWKRRKEIPAGREKQWLFVVTSNLCRNYYRKERTQQETIRNLVSRDRVADVQIDAHAEGADMTLLLAVSDALDALSDDAREVLRLIEWDGFSISEAAALVGCSPGAFRVRLSRSRGALRREVKRISSADKAASTPPSRIAG
ncbi:MAG: RNA polymerase sigma factor [Mycobacterium sp.]|nr:RNA polymerase sigma factor [Mycobacterium sp.]